MKTSLVYRTRPPRLGVKAGNGSELARLYRRAGTPEDHAVAEAISALEAVVSVPVPSFVPAHTEKYALMNFRTMTTSPQKTRKVGARVRVGQHEFDVKPAVDSHRIFEVRWLPDSTVRALDTLDAAIVAAKKEIDRLRQLQAECLDEAWPTSEKVTVGTVIDWTEKKKGAASPH